MKKIMFDLASMRVTVKVSEITLMFVVSVEYKVGNEWKLPRLSYYDSVSELCDVLHANGIEISERTLQLLR